MFRIKEKWLQGGQDNLAGTLQEHIQNNVFKRFQVDGILFSFALPCSHPWGRGEGWLARSLEDTDGGISCLGQEDGHVTNQQTWVTAFCQDLSTFYSHDTENVQPATVVFWTSNATLLSLVFVFASCFRELPLTLAQESTTCIFVSCSVIAISAT